MDIVVLVTIAIALWITLATAGGLLLGRAIRIRDHASH